VSKLFFYNMIFYNLSPRACYRYGSPTIDDMEAYTIAYRAKLDDVELAGKIPKNISLEVTTPQFSPELGGH
jgi:hypothetical protein